MNRASEDCHPLGPNETLSTTSTPLSTHIESGVFSLMEWNCSTEWSRDCQEPGRFRFHVKHKTQADGDGCAGWRSRFT